MKKFFKITLRILAVIFVLSLIFGVHFMYFQKNFIFACRSCHEMRLHKKTLSFAAHKKIACRKCHRIFPVAHMARQKYFSHGNKYRTVNVTNAACSRCHPHMKETKVFYHDINFSHKKHIEAKQTCSTCHKNFVHRKTKTSPLITLRQCRECHEKKRKHNPPFSIRDLGILEKATHPKIWYVQHKATAAKDKKPCMECHKQKFCDHCHTSYRNHIKDWWSNHYKNAMKNLAECQICHRPNYCISCHKLTIPKSHNKKWGMSHWENIKLKECFDCHTLNFCESCHTRKQPKSHKTIKDHAGMKPEREALCDVCHGTKSCTTCHHRTTQETTCAQCHKEVKEEVTYKGAKLPHRRHAVNGGVDCRLCHAAQSAGVFTANADCRGCHHASGRFSCLRCHSATNARVLNTRSGRFSHNTHASARKIPCASCHTADRGGYVRTSADCSGCHHGGQYKVSCTRCHSSAAGLTVSVRGRSMSHDTHVRANGIACTRCHVPARNAKRISTRTDCGDCHHGTSKKRCGTCHNSEWRASDSSRMDYSCDFCHTGGAGGFASPLNKCRNCHAKVYEQQNHGGDTGQTPGSCTRCHKPHTWKAAR